MCQMRIAIVTSGRFHVLDLARELAALGHDVRFYSYVPRRRAERFGLPRKCHRSLLPYVLPLVMLQRFAPRWLRDPVDAMILRIVDHVAAWMLEPCDVFIGMSGLCVKSAQRARERFGAKVVLERGSRHILSQKKILEAIPAIRLPAVSDFNVRRELWGYDFADVIAIPSCHAARSFLERGVQEAKLFRNPFGVDLAMFPPTPTPEEQCPTAIFVGAWSLRKGCDVLWKACRLARPCRLLHVGPIGDALVPQSDLFIHLDSVPQWDLWKLYSRAHVFVHASREEGLSLVQAQGLACGLPLVCTDRTGGEDLQQMLSDPGWVTVVAPDDPEAFHAGIERAFTKARTQRGIRDIFGSARGRLSWRAYGTRYEAELQRRCGLAKAQSV